MPTQDEEFIRKLRATFNVEAEEHLQAISAMLLELEKLPSSAHAATTIESVYREAHSLKGAARAVDLIEVEAICQALEGVFSAWKRQQSDPSANAFDTVHHALDSIRTLLASPEGGQRVEERGRREELIQRLGRLESRAPSTSRDDRSGVGAALAPPIPTPPATSHPADSARAVLAETVRIPIAKLDARLLEAEDMLVVKAIATQRAAELRELTVLFGQWQKEWAKVSPEMRLLRQTLEKEQRTGARVPPAAVPVALVSFLDWNCNYLRSLENRLVSLAAQAQRDRHSIGSRVDDLLEDSKKMLMLPFATLAGMFPKVVRDLCRDQGKDADLVVRGGEVEIDKRILEEMKDAFIHILRNCVDHGVEESAERVRLNKPARATITVAASQINGSEVEIVVFDDGSGVDLERVKESAVRHGVLSEEDRRALSEGEALELIFRSDVSTSPMVTSISGRGLGMAIARTKTEKLGGELSIESKRHIGTTLRIVLPLTMATFRGILVSVADQIFVVPIVNVERVLRIKPDAIRTVENRETVSLDRQVISLARLGAILAVRAKPSQGVAAPVYAVVLHSSGQRIAFMVDDVLHEEEVLVKPLRKPLARVRNITGAAVLGSGKIAPVLNVTDLMESARVHSAAPAQLGSIREEPQAALKKVLVVEDSITSRMLLKGILESAGYEVQIAVDGIDAFTALREADFDLVVSDVEMPRMNGFDLTARIRADKRLVDLPVVLVTALESREERERGIDTGADAYIVKSSFDQSNLLEVVRRLL